jgi:Spy/CpxP family protein refolding chaperone
VTKLRTLLFVSVISSSLLLAQDATTPTHQGNRMARRVNYLTTVLNLTPAQQQQAAAILTNATATAHSLRSNIHAARENLATAITNNDTATVEQASNALGGMTAQLISNKARAAAALRQILTPEQRSKLDSLRAQGMGRFGHGDGPGSSRF